MEMHEEQIFEEFHFWIFFEEHSTLASWTQLRNLQKDLQINYKKNL